MLRKTLTVSLAAIAAVAVCGGASAQEAPKREPRPALTRTDIEQRTSAAFARLDTNKDGVLNQADRDARKKAAFDRIDSNSDGVISPEEFSARRSLHTGAQQARVEQGQQPAPRTLRRSPARPMGFGMTGRADADKDGSITQAEFAATALARFDSVDADKDGAISRDEIRNQRRSRHDHRRAPAAG